MNILLLGKNGQLGWELHRTLSTLGEVLAVDLPEVDLASEEQARWIVHQARPQVIVNAAAYTAVERAESEPEVAFAINARAVEYLAEEAAAAKAALVHLSTDYVFDGIKGSPYQESDLPNPLGVYGASKLAGEQAIQQVGGSYLILRTSWLYSLRSTSFVTKVLQWAREQLSLRVVTDQIASPTWARLLAETTAQVLAMGASDIAAFVEERRGVYHLAGSGAASRLEWAQAILRHDPRRAEQVCQEILPATTDEFPSPAKRPRYSALDCALFTHRFALRLPEWEQALLLALIE
ncbi:MAG: dTDP-4-dehydrorhamnose reductase [Anaerolineales bacterium]|nr:dTDP-4-dehydrorhamnose reductase [Anaerolineales bacterium]